MAAGNGLRSEQLAALAPGDVVVIESAGDFRQPRRFPGTVVRIEAAHIVVSSCSPRGVRYVQRYGRRNGVRVGGQRSTLVNADVSESASLGQRRQALRIEALYREWRRNRSDLERLRRLQAAIGECPDKVDEPAS